MGGIAGNSKPGVPGLFIRRTHPVLLWDVTYLRGVISISYISLRDLMSSWIAGASA